MWGWRGEFSEDWANTENFLLLFVVVVTEACFAHNLAIASMLHASIDFKKKKKNIYLENWLERQVGITRTHTSFLNDEMKDNETSFILYSSPPTV